MIWEIQVAITRVGRQVHHPSLTLRWPPTIEARILVQKISSNDQVKVGWPPAVPCRLLTLAVGLPGTWRLMWLNQVGSQGQVDTRVQQKEIP